MNGCHLCGTRNVLPLLDFGKQPITNRFLASPDAVEGLFPLALGQCEACGVVQLSEPPPAKELKPKYDWITYTEPEAHLDHLADILAALPGLGRVSNICGLSFKDDSLLERMKKRGFERVWRLDPGKDLGIDGRGMGVETIQDQLVPDVAKRLAHTYGKADLVILRHILEHAHHTITFMGALKELVSPEGYLVIEVPDCRRALEKYDYSTVWEEHTLYFTPDTFRQCFGVSGLCLVRFETFPYAMEDSLVGIGRQQHGMSPEFPSASTLEQERRRMQAFCQELDRCRSQFHAFLSDHRQMHGAVAMFGAGHLGCAWINLLGLKACIDFVVDDDPHKQGLFMAGSRLPIRSSRALLENRISLCLLSVAPTNEGKVIENNQGFREKGGIFLSIFPDSQCAFHKAAGFHRG